VTERDELFEELGQLADSLDSGLHATKMKLPPSIHITGMSGIMRNVRDKLAEIVKRETGEDPWETNPLDG
jgi:hypothetical protein